MHLIRPYFLLLLIPAVLVLWSLSKSFMRGNQWQKACDPHLLSYLTITNPAQNRVWPLLVVAIALFLAIVAMAGPSWKKTKIPMFNSRMPLVILLDLSYDMTAKDLKPNRLERAKYKIIDLLKARKSGQTALVAYTNEPFVVTPLTEDTKTIANLLHVLEPSIMPVQGHNVASALKKAAEMIQQAGANNGQVLVVSNQANDVSEARKLRRENIITSVLGVGTKNGAPIVNADGQLIKNEQGELILSSLKTPQLERLAAAGGGAYQQISTSNRDIKSLARVITADGDAKNSKLKAMLWQDEGHWFILLLLPLFALVFRRGYL